MIKHYLNKQLKYQIIIKRHMMMAPEEPEIQQDIQQPNRQELLLADLARVNNELNQLKNTMQNPEVKATINDVEDNSVNDTTENLSTRDFPVFPIQHNFHTPEAKRLHTFLIASTHSLQMIGDKAGKHMPATREAAEMCNKHVMEFDVIQDEIKKAIMPFWKQTWFTWSAYTATFLIIAFKLYQMRALPNFIGVLADTITFLLKSGKDVAKEASPKPEAETIIKAFIDTPLSPATIVTGVGTLALAIGAIKIIKFLFK